MLTQQPPPTQEHQSLPPPLRDESEVVSRHRADDDHPTADAEEKLHGNAQSKSAVGPILQPKRRPPPIHTQKPPFTYHPEYIPVKGILKPAPPPPQRTSWFTSLGSLNTRLGNAISNAYPVAPSPTEPKKAPFDATAAAAQRSAVAGSFSTFKKIMNTQVRPSPLSPSNNTFPSRPSLGDPDDDARPLESPLLSPVQSDHPPIEVGADSHQHGGAQPPSPTQLLHPSTLKRVRFSVGKLTTEYYPYAAVATTAAEADSNAEPELVPAEGGVVGDAEANDVTHIDVGEIAPPSTPTTPTTPVAEAESVEENIDLEEVRKVYSAREVMQYYLTACKNREEFPLERLMEIMRSHFRIRLFFLTSTWLISVYPIPIIATDQHKYLICHPSLQHYQGVELLETIDLSNDIIDRKLTEPLADVLTLECGLQRLVLENCGLEDDTLKVLLHSLLVTDSLPHLSLANNKKIKANGFKYIAVYIKKSASLKYLNIANTLPDKKAAQYLSQSLTPSTTTHHSTSLETLILDSCQLKTPLLELLAPGIRRSSLRILSLRNNKINHLGALWIGVILRDYEDADTVTSPGGAASGVGGGPGMTRPGQEEDRLKGRTWKDGLQVLDLRSNEIRTGMQYIAQSLRRNRSLRELKAADCKIDGKGCVAVGDALRYEVGGGLLTSPEAQPVALLRSNTINSILPLELHQRFNQNLDRLDLSRNQLCVPNVDGINAIKTALFQNRSLKELVLAETGLTSEGRLFSSSTFPLFFICSSSFAAIEMPHQTTLTPSTLPALPSGAIALAECLPENKALVRLDLSSNPGIDIAGVMALSVSIKMNHTLTYLDVNVPPNDVELARLSREIVSTCTRNTEGSFRSERRTVDINRIPSQTSSTATLDLSQPRTFTPPPANPPNQRLSLQERLAAATKGAKGQGQTQRPSAASASVSTIRGPEPATPVVAAEIRRELVQSREAVSVLREVLEAENARKTKEENEGRGAKTPPGEVVAELYSQCQRCQAPLLANISRVSDEHLLEDLLAVNDELTSLLQVYEDMYDTSLPPIPDAPSERPSTLADVPPAAAETPVPTTTTPATLPSPGIEISQPTFSIGDDEDDDDNLPLRRPASLTRPLLPPLLADNSLAPQDGAVPRSPLEELRKEKEEEEGVMLRKAKEVVTQELMATDDEENGGVDLFVDAEDEDEGEMNNEVVTPGLLAVEAPVRGRLGSIDASGEELKTQINLYIINRPALSPRCRSWTSSTFRRRRHRRDGPAHKHESDIVKYIEADSRSIASLHQVSHEHL
ncbi:hypothetical protein BC938DRAFT_476228 [Jimgerdemannia flammicorona]|uniref:GAT domain-containing protein n=1 Tax=Jimgerdemannia flammicorona TaxID=994334 RepID=A0A433QQR7_9FUNG|nr:hypothetical protein BC938DRAFT_476228 [Jimgerdemannia flammicorona]